MNILFAGSPQSSARILEFLFKKDDISVVGAITQPDKRSGRGKNLIQSDVSLNANVLGIRTFKPENLNTNEIKDEISSLEIDFLVVIAYGKIIPKWLLKLPKISPINIHFSLLPKYRGASPIQTSLINGDTETGVSFMQINDELDSGDIYKSFKTSIDQHDNKISLEKKLTDLCIENICQILHDIEFQRLRPIKQDSSIASYCNKLSKTNSLVDFNDKSENIMNKFRAYFEWPGLTFSHNNVPIKIKNLVQVDKQSNGKPGVIYKIDKSGIYINTKDKMIVITNLQFPNKKTISSNDAYNSYRDFFS
jgi:methionyl-tRNA formyltransferase